MNLQHEAVIDRHARHLGEHLGAEQRPLAPSALPVRTLSNSAPASLGLRFAVSAAGWPWSDEVAPNSLK